MSPLRGLTYKTHDYPTLRSVVGFASSLTSGGVSNSRASSRLWIKIKPMALLSQSSTFNRRQKSVDFVFLCHDSAIFKQAWLRLPPSHLGNIQASLASPSSFAPRQYSSKLDIAFGLASVDIAFGLASVDIALGLASVSNSCVSSRLSSWTCSWPWIILLPYRLSDNPSVSHPKVLPDSNNKKKNFFPIYPQNNREK